MKNNFKANCLMIIAESAVIEIEYYDSKDQLIETHEVNESYLTQTFDVFSIN
jgi:hypothetical protein